jgi:hypothetical protein
MGSAKPTTRRPTFGVDGHLATPTKWGPNRGNCQGFVFRVFVFSCFRIKPHSVYAPAFALR